MYTGIIIKETFTVKQSSKLYMVLRIKSAYAILNFQAIEMPPF